ncbi:auxin-responsive protein IAA6-like [Carica papaya]|uniref:auxin-responsive protein IAA6-like n=1 Tax=Carica papaya TaxID=3649 RepID=UPI000B8CCF24|nr:auxin-responsive protein IAA6-like [Carica papaya]
MISGSPSSWGEGSPPLLTLINKESQWLTRKDGEERRHGSSEEKKLELRLAPPEQDWSNTVANNKKSEHQSLLCLGFSSSTANNVNQNHPWTTHHHKQHNSPPPFLHFSSTPTTGGVPHPQPCLPVMVKESSQPCCTKLVDLQNAEKKAFSPSPANTAVLNTSQKRSASGPVVGWPPIRSYRKNLGTSSCSKAANGDQSSDEKAAEVSCKKGMFVKINMDGVPIGRKVDLKTHDSYQKLSTAVDQLFRGLLAGILLHCLLHLGMEYIPFSSHYYAF